MFIFLLYRIVATMRWMSRLLLTPNRGFSHYFVRSPTLVVLPNPALIPKSRSMCHLALRLVLCLSVPFALDSNGGDSRKAQNFVVRWRPEVNAFT